jgi:tetratricopeptide (TPR) repeat protein
MQTASSARSTAPRRLDVAALQQRLAFRLLLVSLVPLAVIAVLALYAYRLSSRLAEVEVLERVSFVDRVYRDTHNVGWALAEYESLAGKNPNNPRILVRLGALYHQAGDDTAAVARLARAIALKPNEWEAHSTLAYVELQRGRFTDAIKAAETAISLSDTDMQAHNNLAWIYATAEDGRLRNLPRAVVYAERAVTSTHCRQQDYLDTLAEVYRRSGRAEDAAKITTAGAATLALCERAKATPVAKAGR